MRPLYVKFSLVFLLSLLSGTVTCTTVEASILSEVVGDKKDKVKDKDNPTKPRTENGGKTDRPKKDEVLPIPAKQKRKVNTALPTPSKSEEDKDTKSKSLLLSTLLSKEAQPLITNFKATNIVGPDPFRFTINSSKEEVQIGEEFELTVSVDWVDFGMNNGIKFLPEWYKYTLKVVMPKGFIQTGGDYIDYCTKPVDAQSPQAIFKIKGKFEFASEESIFKVLRGFEGADERSEFIFKGEKSVNILPLEISKPSSLRIADSCFSPPYCVDAITKINDYVVIGGGESIYVGSTGAFNLTVKYNSQIKCCSSGIESQRTGVFLNNFNIALLTNGFDPPQEYTTALVGGGKLYSLGNGLRIKDVKIQSHQGR